MKKTLFIAVLTVLGLTNMNAQEETIGGFEKGDLFASGIIDFSSYKKGGAEAHQFTFSPSLGYFINNNIALELGLIFGAADNIYDNKTNVFGSVLGATYYFTPSKRFSFALGADLEYQSLTFRPGSGDPRSKNNTFGFSVSPGLNYFVSNKVALTGSIGALSYTNSKDDFTGAEAENKFDFNIDLSNVNFGIIYKF